MAEKSLDAWKKTQEAFKFVMSSQDVGSLERAILYEISNGKYFVIYLFKFDPSIDDVDNLEDMQTEFYASVWGWVSDLKHTWHKVDHFIEYIIYTNKCDFVFDVSRA